MSDFFSKVFKFDYLGQLMKGKRMCFCIPCFFPHDAAASDDDQSEHDHSALVDYLKAVSTFFCNPFFGPSPSPSPARIESCQKVFDDKSGLISVLNLSRNTIKKSKNVVFGLHMSGDNTAKNDTFSSCSRTPTLDLGGAAAGGGKHDSKNNNDENGHVVFEIGEAVPLDAELPIPYLFYDVNGLNPNTTQCPVVTGYHSNEFLSFCHLCKEKLDMGRDIYMYRGNRAFCSMECRYKEILDDELWGMKTTY